VVEGHLLEDGVHVGRGQGRPVQGALGCLGAEERDVDHGAQRGQFAAQFGDGLASVVFLAAVAVAVDREEHDGFDLLEPVEDASGAEVRRAGGPDAAHGGCGEEGDHGLRDVGEVAADAVPGTYAESAQLGSQGADLAAQLGPGDGAGFVCLVDVQEGWFVGAGLGRAQGVFGVVEGRFGEPLGARHRAVAEHARVGGREADVEPLGDGFPEGVQVVDGPALQGRVAALGGGAVVFGGPGLEPGDPCPGDALGVGLPERLETVGRHGRLPDCARRVRPPRTGWGVRVSGWHGQCHVIDFDTRVRPT
jgi:hypothetical protein